MQLGEFPARPDQVTAGWLSEKLRSCGLLQDGKVAALDWEPIGTGQVGDSVRFRLSYANETGGPATLAAKFPAADEPSRSTAAMLGLYAKEVQFYRDLAPQLAIRTPRSYAAEICEETGEFILLFEDLGPARGGNQLDS